MRVILLRGLLREKRHWGDFPDILQSNLGSEFSVEALDLPGIGTQRGTLFSLDIDEVVHDLRTRSEVIMKKDKILLVSNSLGSMIAMKWAELFPEDLSGVVLMNTSASNISDLKERISKYALKVFAQVIAEEDPAKREAKVLSLVSSKYINDSSKAEEWGSYAMGKKETLELGLRQLWVASKFHSRGVLDVPSLVLCSLQDRLLDPMATMKVARAIGAEQRINHVAGHDLPLDDPEWVSLEIKNWIKSSRLQQT